MRQYRRSHGGTASLPMFCSGGAPTSASARTNAKLVAVNVLLDLLQPPDGMTAVEFDDGRRVFAPAGSDPEAVRQHVLNQEAAR